MSGAVKGPFEGPVAGVSIVEEAADGYPVPASQIDVVREADRYALIGRTGIYRVGEAGELRSGGDGDDVVYRRRHWASSLAIPGVLRKRGSRDAQDEGRYEGQ